MASGIADVQIQDGSPNGQKRRSQDDVDFVFPPCPTPSLPVQGSSQRFAVRRIYCVGRNYADHAKEMGGDPVREPPFFFTKPADALVECVGVDGPVGELPYPLQTENLHFEGEVVLAIGSTASNIGRGARNAIYAMGVGVDLTRRDLQDAAKAAKRPWDTSKGFDCSAPVGRLLPVQELATKGFPLPGCGATGAALTLELKVNGTSRQKSALDKMIWDCSELVAELSKYYKLEPGDLVFTGTPAGVGALVPGDSVEVTLTADGDSAPLAACRFSMAEPLYSYNCSYVRGMPMPPFCKDELFDWHRQHIRTRARDVIVSTYPKCGTTWTEQIVLLLMNGGKVDATNPGSLNAFDMKTGQGKVWIEAMVRPEVSQAERDGTFMGFLTKAEFEAIQGPRLIKTHAPVELVVGIDPATGKFAEGTKIVVCMRNPKDACVSMYYHSKSPSPFGFEGPFGAWSRRWAAGNVEFGNYYDWHAGWWQAKEEKSFGVDILWLHFEDMKADPLKAIRKIAEFIGVELDDALLQQVSAGSSFDTMSKSAEKTNSERRKAGLLTKEGHFRKGENGDWSTHFAPDELKEFELAAKSSMERNATTPWANLIQTS